MDMQKFISQYKNPNAERFNEDIIIHGRNEPLIDYIIDITKMLEVVKGVKFIGYEYIEDESKFDTTYINERYRKRKSNKKISRVMHIDESRISKLIMSFEVLLDDVIHIQNIELYVPKRYKKYYYVINGKKLYPIYQLVDNSTYNNARDDSLVLKSVLKTTIKRYVVKMISTEKEEFTVPKYMFKLFKKETNPLLYYLSTVGYDKTLKYMGVFGVVDIVNEPVNIDENYYFAVGGLYIEVKKFFFERDVYVQAIVAMFKDIISRKTVLDDLEVVEYWLRELGKCFSPSAADVAQIEKGRNSLLTFSRVLDNITRNSLKLHEYNKKDTFATVRWMLRHFSELRAKDNMDLANKRLRMAEYIAAYYGRKISTNIARYHSEKRITYKSIRKLFAIRPMDLITIIQKSPLLRFDNSVNDMDLFNSLKWSMKGIGSMGDKNTKSVPVEYRDIHPSYIGRLDLNAVSSSEPGLTGIISPFVEMDGFFFDSSMEAQEWTVNFDKLKREYEMNGYTPIEKFDIIQPMEYQSEELLVLLDDIRYFVERDKHTNDILTAIGVDTRDSAMEIIRVLTDEEKDYVKRKMNKKYAEPFLKPMK